MKSKLPQKPVPFSRLSPIGKRKAIARDVLFRLDSKQLQPQQGSYVSVLTPSPVKQGSDLRSQLKEPEIFCQACAIGAAVVALAAKENRINLWPSRFGHSNGFCRSYVSNEGRVLLRARKALGLKLAGTIEASFEGWSGQGANGGGAATLAFYKRHKTSDTRLRAIFTQVAKTGTFNPVK